MIDGQLLTQRSQLSPSQRGHAANLRDGADRTARAPSAIGVAPADYPQTRTDAQHGVGSRVGEHESAAHSRGFARGRPAAVAPALGTDLKIEDDNVRAAEFSRTDLDVTNDGIQLVSGMELGSEAMFTPTGGKDALVCGEFTLTEAELNPVIAPLESGGIEVTAIHKHLPDESPRLWWLHYTGRGDPVRNAATLRQALDVIATPPPTAAPVPPGPPLDTATIDRVIGHSGTMEEAPTPSRSGGRRGDRQQNRRQAAVSDGGIHPADVPAAR